MTEPVKPARYFPLKKGQPLVAPGLFPFGSNFGNGKADGRLFQLDKQFPRYRENKLACRAERLSKYVCQHGFEASLSENVTRFIATRLTAEYPRFFHWTNAEKWNILSCRLTEETLTFDARMKLIKTRSESSAVAYSDAFDALCCQIPEDVAVVQQTSDESEVVRALHLCAPSHWAAEDKIGRSFMETHAPVPHFEKIAAAARPLQKAIGERGPFVRFAWGIEPDDRLNHHPDMALHLTAGQQRLKSAAAVASGPFYLRVERQVLWGLPGETSAYLFTIRTYTYPLTDLSAEECGTLAAVLGALSPASLRYKGLTHKSEAILSWLDKRCAPLASARFD